MPTFTYGGQALIEGVLMRGRDAVADAGAALTAVLGTAVLIVAAAAGAQLAFRTREL